MHKAEKIQTFSRSRIKNRKAERRSRANPEKGAERSLQGSRSFARVRVAASTGRTRLPGDDL